VVLRAIDSSSNAGYETVTVTVTDVLEIAGFNSLAISGGGTVATYRTVVSISANVMLPSKVTFFANGVRISGCIKIPTSGSAPNIIATCNWRPSVRGAIALTASSTPNDQSFTGSTSSPTNIVIANRAGKR
jgi:hypothetical protein